MGRLLKSLNTLIRHLSFWCSMAKSRKKRPQVVVAGPGAGKTHNMVKEIVSCVPQLHSCRFLAAITYTNAAAEVIKQRLHRIYQPSPNIFVGTIHAFLNRFILAPYASVIEELSDDPIFMAIDPNIVDKNGKKLTGMSKSIVRQRIYTALIKKGIVPYEQMGSMAANMIERSEVRRLVGHRLQYLFVDEFQDVDTTQHRVFDSLRKEGRTNIYVVGDPEQYISSFTYRVRSVKAPEYNKLPFFRFIKNGDCTDMSDNHRSCKEIVAFTNQFHARLNQDSVKGPRNIARVFLISDTHLENIVEKFQEISDREHSGKDSINRLYLGFENSTFDECRQQYGLVPVSNDGAVQKSLLAEALEVIAKCLGTSQRKARTTHDIAILEWRKLGIALIKKLRTGTIKTHDHLMDWLDESLTDAALDKSRSHGKTEMGVLLNAVLYNTERSDTERMSSIHKAKGLEADAVLVVAKTLAELKKWCETDSAIRQKDKIDSCRVGFVAFSRAKEVLCIACRKKLDSDTKQHMRSLGVKIV